MTIASLLLDQPCQGSMHAFATLFMWCPLVSGATGKFFNAPPQPLSLDGENSSGFGDSGHLAKHVITTFDIKHTQ